MKDKAIRGATAELVHIRTPDNQRKAIWLEPDFYDALQIVVQPENQPKWLTNVLVDAWGDATESKGTGKGTGKEKANLASAVRCAIVKALVNRATQAEDTIYLKGIESGLSEEWNGADDEAFKQLTNNPKVFLKDTV
jgi:predicted DNA-binding ribbon-helix-helix protein